MIVIENRNSKLNISGVVIDSLLSLNETLPAELSEKPIERGAYVADHIDKQSPTLVAKCIIIEPDVKKRIKKLREFQERGNALNIIGAHEQYLNMVIETISLDKSSKILNGWELDINFKYAHIISAKRAVVEVKEIPVEPPRPAGTDDGVNRSDKVNSGSESSTTPTKPTKQDKIDNTIQNIKKIEQRVGTGKSSPWVAGTTTDKHGNTIVIKTEEADPNRSKSIRSVIYTNRDTSKKGWWSRLRGK